MMSRMRRGVDMSKTEEGAYMTGACMMSEKGGRVGRHDVRDRGEGKAWCQRQRRGLAGVMSVT